MKSVLMIAMALTVAGAQADTDVVVYGSCPAGIAAAIAAKRAGRSVTLLEPTDRIGGLTAGGLGQTDCGDTRSFKGISREFYERIARHYAEAKAWTRQKREDYKGFPWGKVAKGDTGMWTFEPSVAEKVLRDWLAEYGIEPIVNERLNLKKAKVEGEGERRRIVSFETESGKVYRGRIFIDASYEGDLMAAAGVPYRVGREDNAAFGEAVNGVATAYCRTNFCHHILRKGVSPYVVKGDPSSGLLPGIEPADATADGSADKRIQAYCFRLCLTDVEANRIPFAKPAGYSEQDYELLFRNFEAGETRVPWLNSPMPNRKTDINSGFGVSTDFIGGNYGWPDGDWETRQKIYDRHVLWTEGLLWTLANHPRVPEKVRREVSRWGWCRDEYPGAKNHLGALYVREARRMQGVYTMTEADCLNRRPTPKPVAEGNYTIDSHHVRRLATSEGVLNEGNVQIFGVKPYPISYDALVPEKSACANLIVPVCLSSTHTAFGSIRMEPVYFSLGEVAGRAAALAVERACAVQDVPFLEVSVSQAPPPAPDRKEWGFLKDLRTRTPFRAHWTRGASSSELDLLRGVRLVDGYGVAGDLETARTDLERFLAETKLAGAAVPLTLAKGKVNGRESYRLDVAADGVTLTAEDDDGLRRSIYRFERRVLASAAPALPLGSETRTPWLKNRISRCFFSPIKRPPFNHDELTDDIDYYPEAYLDRLAHEGVNGLWLSVSFRELARTSLTPTDPLADRRLDKLRATVAKCRRYGIRTWLFCIEPFSLPADDPFLKAHPEIRGSDSWNHRYKLCPSEPVLRQYLREATKDIFTRVPGLGGVIDICHGERPTTCMSEVLDTETGEGFRLSCPKCSKRQPWEIFNDALTPMIGGMREANPESEFICWFYQPLPQVERADWVFECAQHLPEGVIFQYNFESGACKLQEGKWRVGGDYWLSFAGPAVPFKRVAAAARQVRAPLSAKIQVGCSHEVATVPYVPAPGLLYRKYREMRKVGVSSAMMCWFFGNYPGVMNEAAGELAFETFEKDDEKGFLEDLARAEWGELAPDVAALWEAFTDGYMDYPLSNQMQYYGPVHAGVAWPLDPDIALAPLGRTWKPEDAPSGDCIAECLENHSLSEALALVRSMCRKADAGAAARLAKLSAAADDRTRKLDVGVMQALRCQFLAARDALEFYWCRREAVSLSRDRGDFAGALRAVGRMREIVRAEREIDREMIPLCEYDARLGFHSEAENHQYHADKLRWRMMRLDAAEKRLNEIAAELSSGRPYPESVRERTAPVWKGVRREADGSLRIFGKSPGNRAGTVHVHAYDRCGTVSARSYTVRAGEDGSFELVLPATDWDGDKRLEPYWIRFRQGQGKKAAAWPRDSLAPHRLCLYDVEGCRFGRLADADGFDKTKGTKK